MNTKEIKPISSIILPDFIEGIPTKRHAINERRALVVKYYNDISQ